MCINQMKHQLKDLSTTPIQILHDPLQQLGKWGQNQTTLLYIHNLLILQSTCHVGGGMDDRLTSY